jgi:hypothetical protein
MSAPKEKDGHNMEKEITKKAFMEVLDLAIELLDERITQNELKQGELDAKMAKRVKYLDKHDISLKEDKQSRENTDSWYLIRDEIRQDMKKVKHLKLVKRLSK